jgi:hypothetical protein
LNPVSVSTYPTPSAAASFDSIVDETIVVATATDPRCDGGIRSITRDANSTPISSPDSNRQPRSADRSGTATPRRSASGSLASTTSASTVRARSIARSSAPGSSGFGNDRVGKSGSGSACSVTTCGAGRPAWANAVNATTPPTPCIGVYTVTSRGRRTATADGSTNPTMALRYRSTTSGPRRCTRSSSSVASGSSRTGPTASIAAEISRSTGETICDPVAS